MKNKYNFDGIRLQWKDVSLESINLLNVLRQINTTS